jgi:hypothetical protein
MRAKFVVIVLSICCGLGALAAAPASAAQRIDLKVLLLGTTGSEPSFLAWQAQLKREGVPFDQIVATPEHAPITAATLSTTLPEGTQEARYQAVIVAVGNLPRCNESGCVSALSTEEWTALQTYEATFHVRQLTAYAFPGAEEGLTAPTSSGPIDGTNATLTAAGQSLFPYLKGTVTIGPGTWGYGATPLEATTFSTLLTDPSGDALLGVFTHPDGREEMVQTFDSNAFQIHSELLRHGQLAWVTRGTYLGDQRNYLEMQVDDIFLGDDIWNPAVHATDFNPADAVRMTAADVTKAVEWSRANGLRLDALFNGGGSVAYAEEHGGSDPLLTAFQANKTTFGWVSHTYDHPNLDCSTRLFIVEELTRNSSWATANGFSQTRAELVTGEHSGLANLIPGIPGMIDPPDITEVHPAGRAGTLPAGAYDYAITALDSHGETVGARTTTEIPAGERGTAAGSFRLTWAAICHATGYRIYRRSSPAGAWSLIGSATQPTGAFRDTGALTLTFRDTGFTGTPGEPPVFGTAILDPYAQNPSFAEAMRTVNARYLGGDASKPYPQNPLSTTGPVWPKGTSFMDGISRVIPRYPTNVYYNTATQAQQLDEYNYLYLPPSLGGGCVESPTNTCRTSPATWEEYVAAESDRIFGLMMGNDPRPHYFHQTNLAESSQAGGAVFYPVLEATLADYTRYFNSTMPIVQLTPTQIGVLIERQDAWAVANASTVTGYVEGTRVVVSNGGAATTIPLAGTEAGTVYGGTRSGWVSAAAGTSNHTAATAWPPPPPAPPAEPPPAPLQRAAVVKHAIAAGSAGSLALVAGAQ